jgi:hypothetical protein
MHSLADFALAPRSGAARLAALGLMALGLAPLAGAQAVLTNAQSPADRAIAIECAAAMNLMREVAPKWSNQPGFDAAEAAWLSIAGEATADLAAARERHAEGMVTDPRALSRLAMVCLVDAPLKKG